MHHRRRVWLGFVVCALSLLGPGPAHAAEGGLINVDWSLLVQVVNFLALLAILYRLLYKPLLAKMEERTQAIKRSLEAAEAARAEAARQQEENTARMRAAYAEAQAIRESALKEAAEEQRTLVENARREAHKLVESAKAQTDTEIRRARDELRREVSDLAVVVAEKLIRKSLRDEDHRRIVDDTIARIGR